jgi:alkylation response protein AidB-like acyl-CoA dehydrogenase
VFVPEANLIGGKEGLGFIQLMMNLPLERLSIGVAAAAGEAAFAWTRDYVLSREAFGERIADFQNTRFLLADMATTVDVMWTYNDRAMMLYKDKNSPPRSGREGLVDRSRGGAARHRRAAARRLRVHHRVPHRPRLPRRSRPPHLRRHERDHAATSRREIVGKR